MTLTAIDYMTRASQLLHAIDKHELAKLTPGDRRLAQTIAVSLAVYLDDLRDQLDALDKKEVAD